MSIKNWSENILLGELQDDPLFTEDLNNLQETVESQPGRHVVLDFSNVNYLNSSNIAKLLKLRKHLMAAGNGGKLRLCAINTGVWGVFLVTGLDKIFEFCDNIASGLASIQLEA
ncbi:MAG TPA: STAS domain-containing protein [Phycisphaerae bacterium]|nr:STAS domain-containing protein [Phycisphaerae bacterium]